MNNFLPRQHTLIKSNKHPPSLLLLFSLPLSATQNDIGFLKEKNKRNGLERRAVRRRDPEDVRGPERERILGEIAGFAALETRQLDRPSRRFRSLYSTRPVRVQLAPLRFSFLRSRRVLPSRCP